MTQLTQQRLKQVLHYDPETGIFRWAIDRGRIKKGVQAGTLAQHGRIVLSVDNGKCFAHRAAWLYVTGEWPSGVIDHINGMASDNRFVNLRVVSCTINTENRLLRPGCGARAHSDGGFDATITVNGRRHYIGYFRTKEEASAAYIAAKKRLHPSWHGQIRPKETQ